MTETSITRHLRGALVAVALAAAPALAAAQGGSIISDVGTFTVGGSLGLFASSFSTGVALHLDAAYTFSELQPRLYLEGAGHLGAMFGSHDISVWEAIPKLRLRYALTDPLSIYGDAGLGLAILHASQQEQDTPAGKVVVRESDTTAALLIRFAAGVQYAIEANIYLTLEPVGLNIYTASGSGFAYTLLAGALFRL